MSSHVLMVLISVMVASATAQSTQGQQCHVINKTSVVRLSFKAHRNETGHWKSEIGFCPDGGDKKKNKMESWSLDVDQSVSSSCSSDEKLCIQGTITQDSSSGRPPQQIPAGYEFFESVGYYKFHSDSVVWARARQVCAEEGAHLVILNSEQEANVLKQLFTRYPKEKLPNFDAYNSVWLGVYEQGANGQYFTIFGETLNSTGFTRWYTGQPDDKGSDDCLTCDRDTAGLFDLPCNRRAPYVCELPQ